MIDVEIAYAAGIVDGEGYIGIKKSKAYRCQGRATPGYHAQVQVKMVDAAAVTLLAEMFGGHLYRERVTLSRVRRPLFCWKIGDAQAERALRALLPFLRVKRPCAENVLALRELQAQGRHHRTKVVGHRNFPNSHGAVRRVENRAFSDEYVASCEALWMNARRLNHAPGWAPLLEASA